MTLKALCSLVASAAIVANAVLLAPAPADAQSPPPPERTCNITIGSSVVQVVAGPDSATFPEAADCPTGAGFTSTDCLKWRYRYRLVEGSIANAGITVDADAQPVVAESSLGSQVFNPGAGDPVLLLARNVFDVRAVRFAGPASTILGSVTTSANVSAGKVTAAAKIGSISGFCPISGPSNIDSQGKGKVSVTTAIVDQAGQCTIVRSVDGAGCTVSIVTDSPGCSVSQESATLDSSSEPLIGASCNTQVTFGTGTKYCYTSTFGRLTCVTSP